MSSVIKIKTAPRLRCTACGATTEAACDCGASYMPPGKLAAEAVAKNPELSNAAIAKALGVGKDTVRRMREGSGANAPVEKPVAQPKPEPRAALTDEDFISPTDAKRGLHTIARYVGGALLDPSPGIRACYGKAAASATSEEKKAIAAAADFLTYLKGCCK